MTDNLVQHETDGNVAIITMNRPEKLNAVNHELRSSVSEALIRADDDKSSCDPTGGLSASATISTTTRLSVPHAVSTRSNGASR